MVRNLGMAVLVIPTEPRGVCCLGLSKESWEFPLQLLRPLWCDRPPLPWSPLLKLFRMDPEPLIPWGHKYNTVYLFLAPLCIV